MSAGNDRRRVYALAVFTLALRAADLVAIGIGGRAMSGEPCPVACLREGAINWDGHWYLSIATSGYSYTPGTDSNVAFFPAFPLSVRILSPLLGPVGAGIVAGLIFGLLAVMLVARLVGGDFGSDVGLRAGVLLAAFPTAFFFSLPYADGLLCALVALALIGARRRNWPLACVAAALAGTVRVTGALLIVPIAWEMFASLNWDWREVRRGARTLAWLALVPVGIGAWMLWLGIRFGEPLAFARAQFAGWPHKLTWFFEPIRYTFAQVTQAHGYLTGTRPDLWWAYLLDLTVIAAMLGLAIAVRRRLPASYWLWWGFGVGISLTSGTTNSIARYALVFFPFFAAAALLLRRRSAFLPVVATIALAQLAAAYHFGMGWWIG